MDKRLLPDGDYTIELFDAKRQKVMFGEQVGLLLDNPYKDKVFTVAGDIITMGGVSESATDLGFVQTFPLEGVIGDIGIKFTPVENFKGSSEFVE